MAVVDKENTMTQVKLKELEVESLRNELQVGGFRCLACHGQRHAATDSAL